MQDTLNEYYHYAYPSLVEKLGQQAADEKVALYRELSKEFIHSKKFIIHQCQLLKTAPIAK